MLSVGLLALLAGCGDSVHELYPVELKNTARYCKSHGGASLLFSYRKFETSKYTYYVREVHCVDGAVFYFTPERELDKREPLGATENLDVKAK